MEEKAKTESRVFCPLHPAYVIQTVNMSDPDSLSFFCLECLLEQKEISILSKTQHFPGLFKNASKFYEKKRNILKLGEKPPQQYIDLLSGRTEIVQEFNEHIEEEKRKAAVFFDQMAQEALAVIAEKKVQYLKELDEELRKFHSNWIYFEKQLQKAFPKEEDLVYLCPTSEVLERCFEGIDSFKQLSTFVKDLTREVFSEKDLEDHQKLEQEHMQNLSQLLKESAENKPYCPQNDQALGKWRRTIKNKIVSLIEIDLRRNNLVKELSHIWENGSEIVSKDEFDKIKKWLSPQYPFNPVLIYRSTRDDKGQESSFHQQCDGKKNTITLLKVLFDGDDQPCVIGGFLDEPWHSKGAWIPSEKTFLFSLSSNIKCNLLPGYSENAAYGGMRYGPCFGNLEIKRNQTGTLDSNYFEEIEKLISKDSSSLEFSICFEVIKTEVFTLD